MGALPQRGKKHGFGLMNFANGGPGFSVGAEETQDMAIPNYNTGVRGGNKTVQSTVVQARQREPFLCINIYTLYI